MCLSMYSSCCCFKITSKNFLAECRYSRFIHWFEKKHFLNKLCCVQSLVYIYHSYVFVGKKVWHNLCWSTIKE